MCMRSEEAALRSPTIIKILETLIAVNTFLQLNLINSVVLGNGSLLGSSFDGREIYGVNNIMIRLLCVLPVGVRVGRDYRIVIGIRRGILPRLRGLVGVTLLEDQHFSCGGIVACGQMVEVDPTCYFLTDLISAIPINSL